MSIATEITRLSNAKSALKTSIQNKGVSVPSSTKLDGYPSLVDQIVAQGYEELTVTCSTDQAGVSAEGQILTIDGKNYTVPSNGVVTAKIEKHLTYSISANSKSGYNTPSSQTCTAAAGQRSVTMKWTRIPYGIYILYTDGTTSSYDTKISGKVTVGVVLRNDKVSIVLHPSHGSSSIRWSSNTSTQIAGVTTTTSTNTAKVDYSGKTNTEAVIKSGLAGSAFTWATGATYSNGMKGYLPGCGEMEQIRLNATNINTALNLIGGTQLDFSNNAYWVSTQYNASKAWVWSMLISSWYNYSKSSTSYGYCRSVAEF